jgi:hypothetical protein
MRRPQSEDWAAVLVLIMRWLRVIMFLVNVGLYLWDASILLKS